MATLSDTASRRELKIDAFGSLEARPMSPVDTQDRA
uniref:Uncharacterized protein n=1 Tax=Arundo donax TaxID=35708 RepID=A0A0A9CJJ7_ARUDO